MRRRSRAGDKRVKSRRKSAPAKHRNASKATRNRGASIAGQETVVARLTHERDQALLWEAANSEILALISRSAGDLELVFRTILEHTTRICNANFGTLFRFDGENFYPAAQFNTPKASLEEQTRRGPFKARLGSPLDHVVRTKQVFHRADMAAEPVPGLATELGGARTQVTVPMLKDEALIGAIVIYRQEVRPFTEKQIELVQNFAAQGVIAIENTRLHNELHESLDRQTATSEVLSVISSSPGELEPVFQAMLENATRICDAKFGVIFRFDGKAFIPVAEIGTPPAFAEFLRRRGPFQPQHGTHLDRIRRTRQVSHTSNYAAESPPDHPPVKLGGARSTVDVPMLKDDELIGAFSVYRQEVRPFSDKQIELVKNFAAQAVIAIENARLLNELRQRTTDLGEALEQQTASSDVLKIISSAPGELNAVFGAILSSATRICNATYGTLLLFENGVFRRIAHQNAPQRLADEWQKNAVFSPMPGGALDRLAKTKTTVHMDAKTDSTVGLLAGLADARTLLQVPMLSEDELIGSIGIYRQEIRRFTDKQIALVENFAAQAVIAIENARLLSELRERTEQVVKLNQQLEQRVADQVGEIERMGRLRRFLPQQVADLIVASGTEKQLESHRREITALFCDLRGFTGFSESSDPEDVMALLAEYHAAIGKIIIKYSGTLERYAGDGVMVVFNDPVPVENPALQAVLMALEMRSAIGALTETWHRWGHDIGFGIGIAHGFATLGTIGFEGRFDYAAIGTVSNVASRLCDEAKPGQILISPRVLTKVENAVTVEPMGEFTLKGIRRPMTAYNVLAASPSKPN